MIHTIDIVFRILNFLVVICAVVYAVKKYIVPLVSDAMAQDVQDIQDLKQAKQDLNDHCKKLEQDFSAQEQWFVTMKDRFQLWKDFAQKKSEKESEELLHIIEDIKQRNAAKEQAVVDRLFMKKEVAPMLDDVSLQMKKKYQKSSDQKEFFHKLFDVMKVKS